MLKYPDDYEVVWSGGPLLPDRDSEPDPRWGSISTYYANEDPQRPVDVPKPKKTRVYNKANTEYWTRRGQSGTALRHREASAASEAVTTSEEHSRHGSECVQSGRQSTEG